MGWSLAAIPLYFIILVEKLRIRIFVESGRPRFKHLLTYYVGAKQVKTSKKTRFLICKLKIILLSLDVAILGG